MSQVSKNKYQGIQGCSALSKTKPARPIFWPKSAILLLFTLEYQIVVHRTDTIHTETSRQVRIELILHFW